MNSKRIIAALAIALVAFAASLAVLNFALPSQALLADSSKNYAYVYSGAKSASVDFATSGQTDTTYALFGSSELSTPPSLVPEIPAVVFGANNYGLDILCIGEAFDQSLWHAIAAGAYAPRLANNKVAIVVSPSWFFDGGVDASVFSTRFSYSLYRTFANNDAISNETKNYVRQRLSEQGIESAVVDAAGGTLPVEGINDFVFAHIDDMRLRHSLQDVASMDFVPNKPANESTPDFAQWRSHALEDALERSSNEWGFDDDFWEQNVGEYREQIAGRLASETFTDTPEYDDFGCFLRVCQETGLEPLVIVSPLSGEYYDWVGVDTQTRRACYDHILNICDAYGVTVADFSDKEYEKYFLHDQVHFGWTGWIDVEEAIWKFAKES